MPNYNLIEASVQEGFQKSRSKIQIFGGGFANGKTTSAVVKSLQLSKDYPGSNGLIGRATYPRLNDTIRKEWLRWCPPHWIRKRPTQEDNSAYLVNGSTVNFRYIQQKGKTQVDGSTTSNLLSASYDWIVIDQIEDPEITYKDFLDLLGRLRGDTPYRPTDEEDPTMPSRGPRFFMCTANPSQNWFFHEVVHPYLIWRDKGIFTEKLIVDEDTNAPLIDLFESDTYANKANLGGDYIKTLESAYKGQMRERYLLGKWAAFEGLVYPAFDISRHTITRQQAIAHLMDCRKRHVQVVAIEGYDFGIVQPSCYLLGFVDDFGRVIVLDGFYKPGFDIHLQPAAIEEIRMRYVGQLEVSKPIVADPAIFKRIVVAGSNVTNTTIAKILKSYNLKVVPGNNDILNGIAKVSSYLAGRVDIPHLLDIDGPGPLLYFVDDLDFIQNEFSGYYWKKNPQGDAIDEPIDRNDHAMDNIKYQLSKLPEASKIVIPRDALPPGWTFWREMDMDDYKARVSQTGSGYRG